MICMRFGSQAENACIFRDRSVLFIEVKIKKAASILEAAFYF